MQASTRRSWLATTTIVASRAPSMSSAQRLTGKFRPTGGKSGHPSWQSWSHTLLVELRCLWCGPSLPHRPRVVLRRTQYRYFHLIARFVFDRMESTRKSGSKSPIACPVPVNGTRISIISSRNSTLVARASAVEVRNQGSDANSTGATRPDQPRWWR